MKNRVRILIASRSYTIIGEDSEEHINRVGNLVDARVKEMADAYPELSTADRAVLAAVNVADEHIKTRKKLMRMVEALNQSEQKLNQKLEQLDRELADLKQSLEEAEKQKAELEAAAAEKDAAQEEEELEVVFDMARHQENRESDEMIDMFGPSEDDAPEETQADDETAEAEIEAVSGDAHDPDDWDDVGYLQSESESDEDDAVLFGDETEDGQENGDALEPDWQEADDSEALEAEEALEDEEPEEEESEESEDALGRFADEAEFEAPEVPETDEMMPMETDGWQTEDPGVHQTSFNLGDEPETDEEELYPDTSLLDDNRYDGYKED